MIILVAEAEAFELVAPEVVEDVPRRLVRGRRGHRQPLELRVKIFCFARVRLQANEL